MSTKKSSDSAGFLGGLIIGVIVLITMIPKPVWITLGVIIAVAIVIWIVVSIVNSIRKAKAAADEQARVEHAQEVATAKRRREEKARRVKERRIELLGRPNAELVESTLRAVKQIAATEAAQEGWLGDVDFSADVKGITDNFKKAYELRGVARKLSALAKPSADDRKILADAVAAAENLERVANEWVELIGRCATEAGHIDESLRAEREDAAIAEQRSELHAELSSMLYGIEAAPETTPADSTAEAVQARVQAYLEIKNQIQQTRSSGEG